MSEPETIRMEISSDGAFLPSVRQFVSDAALAAGFCPKSAGLAEAEANSLWIGLSGTAPGSLLRLDCSFTEKNSLVLTLSDASSGKVHGMRTVRGACE
jgi:hypothetical protein